MASDAVKNVGHFPESVVSAKYIAYADHLVRGLGMVDKVNNNGGALVTGDVVVSDSSLANAVKETTTSADLRPVYVVPYSLGTDNAQASKSIAHTETGFFFAAGARKVTVNCDTTAVALDEYLITSTTAKKATASGVTAAAGTPPPAGAFAIAREAKGSGASAIQGEMLGVVAVGGGGYPVEGRLTLTTATPVTTADVTAATTLYFTPFRGNRIALYDGSAAWSIVTFSELSIAVPSTTSQMYDVFVYNNSGTATLELLAWSNDTTRATALTKQNGVLVKTGATDRRYVGSVRTTTVSGQTEDSQSSRYVWNYYNRVSRFMQATDTTDTWAYSTATWRAANNSTALGVMRNDCVVGVVENAIHVNVRALGQTNSTIYALAHGVGINSTSTNSAQTFGGSPVTANGKFSISAEFKGYLAAGYNYIQRIEIGHATPACTFTGDAGFPTQLMTGMTVMVEG